jgi:hypothetical protein
MKSTANVLDQEKVREIRVGSDYYKIPAKQLAYEFGISVVTAHQVIARKTWKHVDAPCDGMAGSEGCYSKSIYARGASDDLSYNGVHQRLRRVLGDASNYACVDCGKEAQQWSLTITESTVIYSGRNGKSRLLLPFSRNLDDYDTRCGSCHVKRDNQSVRGSTNGNSKLVEEEVLEIRYLFDNKANRQEIADYYDVSLAAVYKIGSRDYWSWLAEEEGGDAQHGEG